jgi:hypothetical protein
VFEGSGCGEAHGPAPARHAGRRHQEIRALHHQRRRKWIELSIEADPIYQTILIAAEKSFWRSVKTGDPPALFDCEPPKPRIEAVRVVDIVTH